MPELPEVETVRRGLQPIFEGAQIVEVEQRRPNLRYPFPPDFVSRLRGRTVISLARRAKYLIAHLDRDPVLICHLGMSGSFRVVSDHVGAESGHIAKDAFHYARSKDEAHDHVVFHLSDDGGMAHRVIFNDPRRFGFMLFCDAAELGSHPSLATLGVEPTGNELDGPLLAGLLANRRTPIKAALLDQRLIAGLGNIYVCEALWRAGIAPTRQAGEVAASPALCENLARDIRSVIAEAIVAGGSSLRDHVRTDGSLGYFQHSFSVYDREGQPCHRSDCQGDVTRITQAGRSTFYCPSCQA